MSDYNEKKKEKFSCECGGKYTHEHKKRHERTSLHIKFIQTGEKQISATTCYNCECGKRITREHKKQHERYQKHIKFLNK